MAGLLTYFIFDSLPIQEQWRGDQKIVAALQKITAAGTVSELHGIPF